MPPGAQNGIVGNDANFGLNLPDTAQQANADFAALQQAVKFSKTKEFKAWKDHLEERIKFYQTQLPGGQDLHAVEPEKLGHFWLAADRIITELRAILSFYDKAAEAVKYELAQRKTT